VSANRALVKVATSKFPSKATNKVSKTAVNAVKPASNGAPAKESLKRSPPGTSRIQLASDREDGLPLRRWSSKRYTPKHKLQHRPSSELNTMSFLFVSLSRVWVPFLGSICVLSLGSWSITSHLTSEALLIDSALSASLICLESSCWHWPEFMRVVTSNTHQANVTTITHASPGLGLAQAT